MTLQILCNGSIYVSQALLHQVNTKTISVLVIQVAGLQFRKGKLKAISLIFQCLSI